VIFQPITDRILRALRSGAANNAASIVEDVKKAAQRPAEITGLPRDYFEGRHLSHFAAYLATHYRRAMRKKEILPVAPALVRTWCETEADIYRNGQPHRVGHTEAATNRLAALCKQAETESVLPEAEVRAVAGRQMFLRVGRNPKTDRLEITRHWPDAVWVVADPAAPTSLQHAYAVMLQRGPELYEIWRRVAGGWQAEQIDHHEDNPTIRPLFEDGATYAGRLPIVALRTGLLEGSPYLCDNADMIDVANVHCLLWTEATHVARHQAHNPIIYSGNDDDITPEAGPGGITRISGNATMTALQVNPQIDQLRELTNDFGGAIARSRGQSPRANSVNPPPLNSGVALRVDNQIAEEKRPQRVALFRRFERLDLLPVLDEVERLQEPRDDANRIPAADIDWDRVRVNFPRAPTIEDPAQRNLRLEHAQNAGWVSPARAATEAGYYETIEEAEAAGLSSEAMPRSNETGNFPGFPGRRGPTSSIKALPDTNNE
jgi:hypothetical protein